MSVSEGLRGLMDEYMDLITRVCNERDTAEAEAVGLRREN